MTTLSVEPPEELFWMQGPSARERDASCLHANKEKISFLGTVNQKRNPLRYLFLGKNQKQKPILRVGKATDFSTSPHNPILSPTMVRINHHKKYNYIVVADRQHCSN
jgi:hypothetical protein